MDLFDIHFALFETDEKVGLTLDMSSHENKVEGLPFNLDFILRNRHQICPQKVLTLQFTAMI